MYTTPIGMWPGGWVRLLGGRGWQCGVWVWRVKWGVGASLAESIPPGQTDRWRLTAVDTMPPTCDPHSLRQWSARRPPSDHSSPDPHPNAAGERKCPAPKITLLPGGDDSLKVTGVNAPCPLSSFPFNEQPYSGIEDKHTDPLVCV